MDIFKNDDGLKAVHLPWPSPCVSAILSVNRLVIQAAIIIHCRWLWRSVWVLQGDFRYQKMMIFYGEFICWVFLFADLTRSRCRTSASSLRLVLLALGWRVEFFWWKNPIDLVETQVTFRLALGSSFVCFNPYQLASELNKLMFGCTQSHPRHAQWLPLWRCKVFGFCWGH